MQTFAIHGQDATSFLNEAKKVNIKPTLAIIFGSVSVDWVPILNHFKDTGCAVFGATSAGEVYEGEVLEHSITAILMDLPPAYFSLFAADKKEGENDAQLGEALGKQAKATFAKPAVLLHSGGISNDAELLVQGMQKELGQDAPLFGGLAGDDFRMEGTFAYANTEKIGNGAAILVLDTEKVEVTGLATSGWEAVSAMKTVTKAEGNVVYELDNQPIMEVFRKLFTFPDEMTPSEFIELVGCQTPLHVHREDGSTVIRASLMQNEEGAFVFAGSVPEGANVQLSIPPSLQITETALGELKGLQQRIQKPDTLLMYSCKARHISLDFMIDEETQGIKDLWFQVPFIGFFSYGEIGAKPGANCDFHNETLSVVAITER